MTTVPSNSSSVNAPARLEVRPGIGGDDAKNFASTLAVSLLSFARELDPRARLVKDPVLAVLL